MTLICKDKVSLQDKKVLVIFKDSSVIACDPIYLFKSKDVILLQQTIIWKKLSFWIVLAKRSFSRIETCEIIDLLLHIIHLSFISIISTLVHLKISLICLCSFKTALWWIFCITYHRIIKLFTFEVCIFFKKVLYF